MSIADLVLTVILTVTPPADGHCGLEVSEPSYSPARMVLSDLRVDEHGGLATRWPIEFRKAARNWGVIEGFCLFDDSGHLLMVGDVADTRAVAGRSFSLTFQMNQHAVGTLKRRLSERYWWVQP